ncbi:hypothetical protein [Dawidia soli]|uniref:Cytochrome c domain-containing protein n=1 Tax=Dawidia soli TaxID=2782352 RepID=A0AAP2DBI9_9BACT|nr:hypothetical protein [Dawidia soli]MBT1688674.1 hypothetical protein [Dawidia soli]
MDQRQPLFTWKYFALSGLIATALLAFILTACNEDGLAHIDNTATMQPVLSEYQIFEGKPSALNPAAGFHLYELSTELFSDYAEKQRLVKVPSGQRLTPRQDDLPDFPDGTILVKTFYYYHDKRDTSKGRQLIETRLEIKSGDRWNVGTYLWNPAQTDARLVTSGLNKTVNWIDEHGIGKVISYHVPSNHECGTCHSSNDVIIPIGPKLRNLNTDVSRDGAVVNQLAYFQQQGVLGDVDPAQITALPRWQDTTYGLQDRARAYLDMNCAHCHRRGGFEDGDRLRLGYDTPLSDTGISGQRDNIIDQLSEGRMPLIGTSMVHGEALELIRSYIKSL